MLQLDKEVTKPHRKVNVLPNLPAGHNMMVSLLNVFREVLLVWEGGSDWVTFCPNFTVSTVEYKVRAQNTYG